MNRKRREKERARQFGDLAAWVRNRPCEVCGGWGEPAHVKTRRNAGAWLELPDGTRVGNMVSLCRDHHTQQHAMGIHTFEARHGIDMEAIARDYGERFERGEEGCALPF